MFDFATLRAEPPRTFAVMFAPGDSLLDELAAFASRNEVEAASVTGNGGFGRCTLAFFNLDDKRYQDIPVEGQADVLSLTGNIAGDDTGHGVVQLHVLLGLPDGSIRGGHLRQATVRPAVELIVTESPAPLRRRYHADIGMSLLDRPGRPGERGRHIDVHRHGLAPT